MTAAPMDGTAVANDLLRSVALDAARFERTRGRKPCLTTVLVGEDPASNAYVKMKANRCRKNGLDSQHRQLPAEADTEDVVGLVHELSADPRIDGILVQHPVPAHIEERRVFNAIAATKDVDGVTAESFGAMSFGQPGFASCTPAGIIRLLDAYDVDPTGREAVVIGSSPILGKPLAMMLLARDATVTICHVKTVDLGSIVRRADIVVAAVGRAELVRGDWIKPGAVVVDAGYNEGKVGDVEFDEAAQRARLITPVPGGVGPVTTAVLLAHTVQAAFAVP